MRHTQILIEQFISIENVKRLLYSSLQQNSLVRKINIYIGLEISETAIRLLGKSKYQTVISQWALNTEQIKHYKTILT